MQRSHFAFGHFVVAHLPGWHFAPCAGRLLFSAVGGPENVDFDRPIAGCAAGEADEPAVLKVTLPLQPGQTQVLAVRSVSAGGVIEQGTAAFAMVQVDVGGALLGPPLAKPTDLAVRPLEGSRVVLEFSCVPPLGYAAGEAFEILIAQPGEQLDGAAAAGIVPADPHRTEYHVVLDVPPLPATLAVRAIAGQRRGPISETATVAPPRDLPTIALL